MARQLRAAGEEVSLLLLIDPDLAPIRRIARGCARLLAGLPLSVEKRKRVYYKFNVLIKRANYYLQRDVKHALTFAARQIKFAAAALNPPSGFRKTEESGPERDASDQRALRQQREDEVNTAYFWAKANHRVQAYPGKTVILLTDEWAADGERRGWRLDQLFTELEIRSIPGTHHIAVSEFAGQLAGEFMSILESVDARFRLDVRGS
jgi:thioesterase domain-containing protein